MPVKVVDIFAGPGGLSEGFESVRDRRNRPAFSVELSIEKDRTAVETLRLRKFYRQFNGDAPDDYYRCIRGEITTGELYERFQAESSIADSRCWHAELGPSGVEHGRVRSRIDDAVADNEDFVLIGGPPCQAYSLAGRSRNIGNPEYDPTSDVRQRLYVEYLQILAEHRPAVFIMENVKGLLSATYANKRLFHSIVEDLRDPSSAVKREGRSLRRTRRVTYRVYSLTERHMFDNGDLNGSIIQAEHYGVPQARHRVILLGVRDDLREATPGILSSREPVPAHAVLDSLPRLRSGLSPQRDDSPEAWRDCLRSQVGSRWVNAGTRKVADNALSATIRKQLSSLELPKKNRGAEFIPAEVTSHYAPEWYCDDRIGGVCNHSSRSHMPRDLYRYMYAACYAKQFNSSPSLKFFPTDLLPDHANAKRAAADGGYFSDRFRVQLSSKPSTTIVSHISKDGHYYIHHDPSQCRSLTVREAARLQTFPDNYFFCGNRTAQYVQVGNAVPPLLARQIGEIVHDLLVKSGSNS